MWEGSDPEDPRDQGSRSRVPDPPRVVIHDLLGDVLYTDEERPSFLYLRPEDV